MGSVKLPVCGRMRETIFISYKLTLYLSPYSSLRNNIFHSLSLSRNISLTLLQQFIPLTRPPSPPLSPPQLFLPLRRLHRLILASFAH